MKARVLLFAFNTMLSGVYFNKYNLKVSRMIYSNIVGYIFVKFEYMETKSRKAILKEHKLRVTDCRLDVLELFVKSDHALSQKDLEDHLTAYDRVTLFRTLNAFMQHGILHKIPNESGNALFGICYKTCSPKAHHHDHVHFKCKACGQLECIEEPVKLTSFSLPKDYYAEDIDVIVKGLCSSCRLN